MKKLLFLVTFLSVMLGYGQIQTFEFSALGGAEASATSNFNDPNLGVSTITRGAGLTASANGGRFNATSWALTSIANAVTGNDYMEFTISPNAGYQFNVNSIVVNWQRSATGNTGISLRSSVDGYASDLGGEQAIVDNTNVQVITFTFSQANSVANVTYRIYGWGEATGGSGGLEGTGNDIIVNGSVTAVGGGDTPDINIKGNGASIVDGATPASLANHTLFGTVSTNTSVTRTYTIENLGSADLVLPANPVSLTLGSAEYTITQPASTTISAGGSTTFSVTFNSATAGLFDDGIEVLSNDADEANYSFDISATAEAPTPEINIRGNSTNIVDGATTPLLADHTSFGTLATGNTLTRTYTIQNTGTGNLVLTAPYVQLGTASTQYTITQPALTTIPPAGSTTFSVAFSSATAGIFDNTIEVLSDDADEATYSFAITAEAVVLNFQPGDISFVGVTTTSDVFSFVNWVAIPVNAQLSFTDNAYDGAVLKTNESVLVWKNNTGNPIPAGTVITVTCPAGAATTDLGTVVSGSLNGLSTGNENVFIYEGQSTSPSFIYGFSNIPWITTGTVNTNNSYLPAALNVTNGNIVTNTLDNYEYTGSRSSEIAIINYRNLVNDAANWTGNNTIFPLSSTDFTYVPLTSKVIASQCGGTVSSMISIVYLDNVPSATQYRVRITNPVTGLSSTIETPNRYFTFKSFSSYDFATTYNVEVELQVAGNWLGYYGSVCQVSTPATPALALTACGMTISNRFTGVYTPFIQGVTSYKFRVTRDVPGAVAQEYISNWNGFMFHYLGGFIYGSNYNVEVAVNTPGDTTFSAYGSPCTVSTPAVPSLVGTSCGATITGPYQGIYTTNLGSNATGYRFEITSFEAGTVILDSALNWFYPTAIPGYVPGRTYEIFVAVKNGTEFSDYGESCFINPVATAAVRFGDKTVASEFKANGFPNPFTNNFTLDITTTSEEKVAVMVYDMIGKLLDRVEVNATDNALELGANYPAGVYNVIVSQGEKVETVRMVKR